MSENQDIVRGNASVPSGVDGAVGVSKAKWFVAIVNNRSEKAIGERLAKMGIENYVPTQEVFKVWKNGKKARVEKVVIPAVIFINCTEERRRDIVKLPFIFRFMTDKAMTSVNAVSKPIAVISDNEINRLKFMLGQSDVPVTIEERPYNVGDKVRIIRGSLAGLEGEVFDMNSSKSEVMVTLEYIGCAKLMIDTINLEVIYYR